MSSVVATTTTTASMASLSMQLARRKETRLRTELAAAVEARKAVENCALGDSNGHQHARKRQRRHEPTSSSSGGRTSTLAFAHKDPTAALAALECVDMADATPHEFTDLGVCVYKYNVRSTSEKLVAKSIYPSTKASAMIAAKATRCVFEMAIEMANELVETNSKVRNEISWHTPQQMVKGRETRGCGIVMYSDDALALVKQALEAAKERVSRCVDAANVYTREMTATAAAAVAVTERTPGESVPPSEVELDAIRREAIGAVEEVAVYRDARDLEVASEPERPLSLPTAVVGA